MKDVKVYQPYKLISTFFMTKEETTKEDLFLFFYDNKKKSDWLSSFPIIFRSDTDYYDPGSKTKFNLIIPPFYYTIKCTKLLPNYDGMEMEIYGWLNGTGKIKLTEEGNGIHVYHELVMSGKNKFFYRYYNFLYKGHDWFMKKRMNILKKQVIKYSKENKG